MVMGPGRKSLTWVGSGHFFVALVRLGLASHLWVWKILPPNPHFLIFLPSGQKKSCRVKKYLDQRRVGPLITAGQKYARVGLGQALSIMYTGFVKIVNVNQ